MPAVSNNIIPNRIQKPAELNGLLGILNRNISGLGRLTNALPKLNLTGLILLPLLATQVFGLPHGNRKETSLANFQTPKMTEVTDDSSLPMATVPQTTGTITFDPSVLPTVTNTESSSTNPSGTPTPQSGADDGNLNWIGMGLVIIAIGLLSRAVCATTTLQNDEDNEVQERARERLNALLNPPPPTSVTQ